MPPAQAAAGLPLGAASSVEVAAEEADDAYLTIEGLEIEDEAAIAAAADEYFCQLMDGA